MAAKTDLGIGERVKALRAALGLSLQEVSDRCGMTKSWLWEIEQGRQRNPTIASALALSRALGVSLDYLTGLSTTMPDLHPEAMRIAVEIDALLTTDDQEFRLQNDREWKAKVDWQKSRAENAERKPHPTTDEAGFPADKADMERFIQDAETGGDDE